MSRQTAPVVEGRVIVVVGVGAADLVPDRVRVVVGVSVSAGTVPEAMSSAARSHERLVEVAVGAGIARASIQTAAYNVGQDYDPRGVPGGHRAEVSLMIAVDDIDRASALLAEASAAVGDPFRVYGIHLESSDPGPARQTAREAAVRAARQQAEELASAAGVRLGGLRSLVEEHATPFAPRGGGPVLMAAATSSAPGLEGGALSVHAAVTATYEILETD